MKTINEIVEELRANGQLDEDKWQRLEEKELSKNTLFKQLTILGGVIAFLIIVIALYFDSYSSALGVIIIGFACFMAKRENDASRLRSTYLYSLGTKKTVKLVKIKWVSGWINSWRIVFKHDQKEENIYHPDSKGNKNNPPFEVGQDITIFTDPDNDLTPAIFLKEYYDRFNLRKEN